MEVKYLRKVGVVRMDSEQTEGICCNILGQLQVHSLRSQGHRAKIGLGLRRGGLYSGDPADSTCQPLLSADKVLLPKYFILSTSHPPLSTAWSHLHLFMFFFQHPSRLKSLLPPLLNSVIFSLFHSKNCHH